MNDYSQFTYCPTCGKANPQNSRFCSQCGNVLYNYEIKKLSKREFLEENEVFNKKMKTDAIWCYVFAVLNVILALVLEQFFVITNLWLNYVFVVLLLVCGLGLQFKKSKICAVGVLLLGTVSCIISIVESGTPTSYLWIAVGIDALIAFFKAEKEYKAYLGLNIK